MTLDEIVAKVQSLDTGLAEVKQAVIPLLAAQQAGGTIGVPPVVTPPTPPPAPNPLYEMDANHLLVHARQLSNGARVDPVVGMDIPQELRSYFVLLPATSHVLSVPRVDLREMFQGYCTRVSDQATGANPRALDTIGSLYLGTGPYFAKFGGFKADGSNWPQAADAFFNPRAYMTPEELAADDAAKAGWRQWEQVVQQPPKPAPTPPPVVLPPGEAPL